MKRIGMYTGTIYDDSTNPSDIKECCKCSNNLTQDEINKAKIQCALCFGEDCLKALDRQNGITR